MGQIKYEDTVLWICLLIIIQYNNNKIITFCFGFDSFVGLFSKAEMLRAAILLNLASWLEILVSGLVRLEATCYLMQLPDVTISLFCPVLLCLLLRHPEKPHQIGRASCRERV